MKEGKRRLERTGGVFEVGGWGAGEGMKYVNKSSVEGIHVGKSKGGILGVFESICICWGE